MYANMSNKDNDSYNNDFVVCDSPKPVKFSFDLKGQCKKLDNGTFVRKLTPEEKVVRYARKACDVESLE